MSRFYITGLYHTEDLNDRTLPAIEVEAADSLDALTRIGLTVWTEEQFQELRRLQKEDGIERPNPITPLGLQSD